VGGNDVGSTTDNARTAKAIAARLGINEVVAEVPPDGKVEAVRRLKRQYGKTAFIGDGINDPRLWPRPMWVLPSARARISPSRRPTSS
jgi:high-affinity K+ transport system ATPase subunit B